MKLIQPQYVIHFHHLGQKQLNELLKISKNLDIDCCYLGHQEVGTDDLIMVSSSIRFSDIQKIRQNYSNWIFLVLDKNLSAQEINQFNEMRRIYYINEISVEEICAHIDTIHSISKAKVQKREELSSRDDQTLAIISHDLKNPLNAIRLDAQILLRNAKKADEHFNKEEIRRFANRIIKTTDRLALMVNDLLDHDKSGNALKSLTRTLIDGKELVDEVIDVVSPIAKRNSLKIKKNISENIPRFQGDKNKIFQVLLNLMSNALKFSQQHTSVYISLSYQNNRVYFSVEDSGPGIDPVIEENIYERYRSGKGRGCGSGLGLYICKTIIEAHQGHIQHTRGAKSGTKFEFYLPIEMQARESDKKKIYLIDDDEDLRDVLSWALNSEGYHVESFATTKSALDFINERSEYPALILSDYRNEGISSMEFLEKKRLLKLDHVPLLFLSASPEVIFNSIAKDNYSEVLCKPIDLDALVQKVSDYMSTTYTQ